MKERKGKLKIMGKRITYWLLIVLIGALAGCGLTGREIRTYSQSE